MNLYHLTQDSITGYDTYSDCVVAAESADEAVTIHPSPQREGEEWWEDKEWWSKDWPNNLKDITAILIGTAAPNIKKGVICSSFHAG